MTREDWKREGRRRVKSAAEGDLWSPEVGSNYIRILPNKRGMDYPPYLDWGIHRNVGPDGGSVRCGLDFGEDCWLCKQVNKMADIPGKADQAKRMERADMMVVQICVVDPETGEYGPPKAWWLSMGKRSNRSMGMRLLSLLVGSKRDYDHPTKGYNIQFERTGTGLQTSYGPFEPDVEPSKVPSNVKGQMRLLEDLIPAYDESVQKDAFFGRKRSDQKNASGADDGDWDESEETEDEDDGVPWDDEKQSPTVPMVMTVKTIGTGATMTMVN